ncbi:hypothetical protein [Bacillus sp. 1NLA3E]|uniref:hypothetical protein n=1 Tax=Bacillus sp. 1NLA3E TaxID=666686 RepID=UPI000247E4F5|nr:hypothetical protein [Bacillus sp. 1NLA3E]AGK54793.1 hypothetical protein B1NLA3E_15235 [Bacillus sp. 1NLA3E]
MKRAVSTLILSLASLFFIGWATTSLYNANIQFAKIMKYPEPPWEISMNAIPLFSLLTFGLILTVVYLVIKQKKKKPISFWLFPLQFSEDDEREKMISGEACRKAFISTWYSAPIIAILLSIYPLIQTAFPYFPILMVMIIPAVQIVVYFIAIRKIL